MFGIVIRASLEVEVRTHLKRMRRQQRDLKKLIGLVALFNIPQHLCVTKINWVNPG